MTEESQHHTVEVLPVKSVDKAKILRLRDTDVDGVNFYEVSIGDYYDTLTQMYKDGSTNGLNGSMSACLGGEHRSSRINTELLLMNVKTPKTFRHDSKNGVAIEYLERKLMNGEIGEDGLITPAGFEHPLETLIINMDLKSSEVIHLFHLMKTIKAVQVKNGKGFNLDIVVIPGDEAELAVRSNYFQYNILDRD